MQCGKHDALAVDDLLPLGKGWRRFCHDLGVDPDALAAPFTEHVEAMEYVLDRAYEAACQFVEDPDADERRVREIADAEHRVLSEARAVQC
jgi:hypothetical protein